MKELFKIFKALSDETRLRILVLLHDTELCVCELTQILNISQPNISKHLAKLRKFDLIEPGKVEQFVFYKANLECSILNDILLQILNKIDQFPSLKQDLDQLKALGLYKRVDKDNVSCNGEL